MTMMHPGVWHDKPSVTINDDGSVYIAAQAGRIFVASEEIPDLIAALAKAQDKTINALLDTFDARVKTRKIGKPR